MRLIKHRPTITTTALMRLGWGSGPGGIPLTASPGLGRDTDSEFGRRLARHPQQCVSDGATRGREDAR